MLKIGDFGLATSSSENHLLGKPYEKNLENMDLEDLDFNPMKSNNDFKLHFSINLKENVGTPLYQSKLFV